MGGVYFVIGGGIAGLLTKYAGVDAAAEATAAPVDNCKLLAAKKSDLGMVIADTGYDAFKGAGMFKKPMPLRVITVIYPCEPRRRAGRKGHQERLFKKQTLVERFVAIIGALAFVYPHAMGDMIGSLCLAFVIASHKLLRRGTPQVASA